ncbi:MAG TPA: protein kinase [Polyangiaceae bacterium]|nr:protein kinase [Polyangiaceae bacterium]
MHSNTAPATDLFSGRVLLGRYRVARQLARGGMGVVHLGRIEGARGFAKPVVIKTILATGGESTQLFAREARIVSQLQHPGIVAVIDFGEVDDSHVMVLEYIHGYNLGQWFRYVKGKRDRMPLPHALHVILAVLDALSYAHGLTRPDGSSAGVVHRDISPGNVLIDVQGRVKIADFGIARTADDEFQTKAGMFRGTLAFSPPESLNGTPVDARSDEYSCAVVLYQLLAGENPFKGSETGHTVARILQHVPAPLSSMRDDVPPAIEAAIAKAMSRDPDERFATVAEFAEALRRGMTWSERDAAREFAAQIAQDFSGDLPEVLGLEPLAARDAAWREGQETSDAARVPLKRISDAVTQTGPREKAPETAPMPAPAPAPALSGPRPQSRAWVFLVLASAIVLSAVLLVVFLRPRADAVPPPIIVEKQSVVDDSPPAATEPASSDARVVAATSTAVSASPSAAAASKAAAKPAGSASKRTLAGAFQQRQGAIQSCFKQNPSSLVDSQHLSVRFDVDTSGHVVSASLSPPAVATQPLGACVLGVARSTNFGAQPEALSFSIPIAARMVQH